MTVAPVCEWIRKVTGILDRSYYGPDFNEQGTAPHNVEQIAVTLAWEANTIIDCAQERMAQRQLAIARDLAIEKNLRTMLCCRWCTPLRAVVHLIANESNRPWRELAMGTVSERHIVSIVRAASKLAKSSLLVADCRIDHRISDQLIPESSPGERRIAVLDWEPDGPHIRWLCGALGSSKTFIIHPRAG